MVRMFYEQLVSARLRAYALMTGKEIKDGARWVTPRYHMAKDVQKMLYDSAIREIHKGASR